MALSSSFEKVVNEHWTLRAEWSATQNISANTSTITMKLYWIADGYGATYTSATKDGATTIDGKTDTFSGSGLAKLSDNQKKLIQTHTVTVNHNSDGTKSVALSAYFDAELDIKGYVGRISISGTANLNTIPRASSITSSANFTAGNNLKITVSRASSSFTHIARVKVNGVEVYATASGSKFGTDVTASLNHTTVFTQLAQGTTKGVVVELDTYSGSTKIGSTVTKSGTVTSPSRSTTNWSGNFNIGDSLTGTITRNHSSFVHTLQLIFAGSTFTLLNKSGTLSWSYATSAIASSLYALTPNSKSMSGKIRLYTYYGSVQVGSYAESNITCYVKDGTSDPTFSASAISYADTNTATVAITGNNQYIIQNNSDLTVTLSALATPKNSATIDSYDIMVNGTPKSLTTTGSVAYGKVNASTNLTLKVRATDSRGNFTEVTKTINMVEYKPPTLTATVKRKNNYENETTLSLSGSIPLITVGTTAKNTITATTGLQYRFKETTTTSWGSWTNFAWTTSGANYTVTNVIRSFDNTKSYNVEFKLVDRIGTYTVARVIGVGQPILYIDSDQKSVGVNMFTVNSNSFDVKGDIRLYTDFGGMWIYSGGAGKDPEIHLASTGGDWSIRNDDSAKNLFDWRWNNSSKMQLDTGGRLSLDRVIIGSQADASATSTDHALTIGNDTVGGSIKIDTNEISSFTDAKPDALHLNADGGDVTFNNSVGGSLKLIISGGEIVNEGTKQLSLATGWVNYGGDYSNGAYWKDKNGVVHLFGLVKGGAVGSKIANLPVGYRPYKTEIFYANSASSDARIDVRNSGDIICNYASNTSSWVSLAGISFKAEN